MPMPPSFAKAMASFASVTVSIAAEMRGVASVMWRVKRERKSISDGFTSDAWGTNSTSSNVMARGILVIEEFLRLYKRKHCFATVRPFLGAGEGNRTLVL